MELNKMNSVVTRWTTWVNLVIFNKEEKKTYFQMDENNSIKGK